MKWPKKENPSSLIFEASFCAIGNSGDRIFSTKHVKCFRGRCQNHPFVTLSDLEDNEAEYLPNGQLQLVCDFTIYYVTQVQSPSVVGEVESLTQSMEKLFKDLLRFRDHLRRQVVADPQEHPCTQVGRHCESFFIGTLEGVEEKSIAHLGF